MAADVIFGTDLMLFLDGEALGAATSCKFNIATAVLETSSKDSGKWVSKKAGKLSWTGGSDNLFVMVDAKKLIAAQIARKPVQLQFSTVKNADADNGVPADGWEENADGYKGSAIITSFDMNAPDGENATYTVSFDGDGALEEVTE